MALVSSPASIPDQERELASQAGPRKEALGPIQVPASGWLPSSLTPAVLSSFVVPSAAKNPHHGEAVHVHKHDEEGIQESTVASRNDINSYFDNLNKQEAKKNLRDQQELSKYKRQAVPRTHLRSSPALLASPPLTRPSALLDRNRISTATSTT